MTEMGIAFLRAHLSAYHPKSVVGSQQNMFRCDRLSKTGPAGAAIEFINRREERIVCDDIYINAGTIIVPVRVSKGGFGPVLTHDMVLFSGQLPPEFCVGRHNRFVRLHFLIHLLFALRLAPEDRSNSEADGHGESGEKR